MGKGVEDYPECRGVKKDSSESGPKQARGLGREKQRERWLSGSRGLRATRSQGLCSGYLADQLPSLLGLFQIETSLRQPPDSFHPC